MKTKKQLVKRNLTRSKLSKPSKKKISKDISGMTRLKYKNTCEAKIENR